MPEIRNTARIVVKKHLKEIIGRCEKDAARPKGMLRLKLYQSN